MRIPINWLKDYVEISDEGKLLNKFTSIGHMQDGPPKKIEGTNVYDLEVRQNRSDCLSIIGVAREASAVLDKKLTNPYNDLSKINSSTGKIKVVIQDSTLCYRFNTVTIEGIRVGPSPDWLKQKLASYGIKSVNNVVDITNFVMVEIGQPLHAFDKDKIEGQTLIIRTAKEKESIVLLGREEIKLDPSDLIIADAKKTIAIAGIMGGDETSVTNNTDSIILEAATYNQASIRRSSIAHQVRTEASTRLEKFLHPYLTELALQRASSLILELCGGSIADHTDSYLQKVEDLKIKINLNRLNSLGGVSLNINEMEKILNKLEIRSQKKTDTELESTIPYFRTDLKVEEDLIEEVLRIYGYDNIKSSLPQLPPPKDVTSFRYQIEEQLRDLLIAAGYDEQITDPLTNEKSPQSPEVRLENSLNADKTMLRTTLQHSLERALKNQQKFRKEKVRLFEIGRIYFREGKNYKEKGILGVLGSKVDYFEIKGLLKLLREWFEVEIENNEVVIASLKDQTYFFEIPLEAIRGQKKIMPLYHPPYILLEDLSLFVPINTRIDQLLEDIRKASSLLHNVQLGEKPQIKDDKKTVFIHLEFSSLQHSLTKKDAKQERDKIEQILKQNYNAVIR